MQSFNGNWDGVRRDRLLKEAMSLKDMGFVKAQTRDIGGTYRIGRIETSVNELKRVLGEPQKRNSPDGKVTMEWAFRKNVTTGTRSYEVVFTIYDYKNPPASDTAKHTFSVGGKREHASDIQKVMKIAGMKMIKEEVEEGESLAEETSMKHFTEMDKAAKDLIDISKRLKGKKNIGGFTDEQAEIIMVANALIREHRRMKDFFDGVIYHIEGVHKKVMSPSKHGNMEIMRDLSEIIRELKKY